MNTTKLREDLRAWKSRSRWSADHMSVAIRLVLNGQISSYTINHFLSGQKTVGEERAALLRTFIDRYPVVECYAFWHSTYVMPGAIGHHAKEDQILERVIALEKAREQTRAAHLAQERKPFRSNIPSGIIPSIEMLRDAYGENRHG